MRKRNLKLKALSVCMAGATALSLVAPMAANAAEKNSDGTIIPEASIATVAAHRAAETAPMILGANLTTTSGVNSVMQEIFGSDYNVNPNQYLYNAGIEGEAKVVEKDGVITGISPEYSILKLSVQVPPMSADLSGQSYATNSDIYLGSGYPANYTSVAYDCDNLDEMVETMHNLAEKIEDLGKDGLYNDFDDATPTEIASDYDTYVNATRTKVEEAIDNGMEKKTVAIVTAASTDNGYEYTAYTAENEGNTSINRAAQYLETTTTNIVDLMSEDEKDDSSLGNGKYKVTDAQLQGADYIITVGFQGSNITKDSDAYNALKTASGKSDDQIFAQLPESTYGIFMNSVENALGQAIMIMGVYNGNAKLGVNTTDAVAYFYDHFYHVKGEYIDDLANEYFYDKDDNPDTVGCFGYKQLANDTAATAAVNAYDTFLNGNE